MAEMKFKSMDDIAESFVAATTIETGALFAQGQVILEAAREGWDVDEVCAYCAVQVRRSKRTAYRRYAVSRTFGEPHPAMPWECHAICADLVDYRSNDAALIADQQQNAREWLQRAVTDDLSTRALDAAIKAAGGRVDVKPVVILDAEMGRLESVGINFVNFVFTSEICDRIHRYEGAIIQITLVQALAAESEAT